MKKIIGILEPFDKQQKLMVFENGNQLELISSDLQSFNDTLFALCDKYQISNVVLRGPKQYLRGLIKQIRAEELTKFNKNTLNFELI